MGPKTFEGQRHKQFAGKIAVDLFLTYTSISAAAPASAKVSMTVASQATHLPPSHCIRVTPSGSFPSDLTRPTGSLVAGKVRSAGNVTVITRNLPRNLR